MPSVSVVVPVYNAENFLPRCIDSILSQTFVDFEIILVDDGSTDNSGKICNEYVQIDSRINVIHKENEGASIARKIGLNYSTGKYIAFVDADDYVNPKYIEKLYSLLIQYNVTISACRVQRVRECEKIDKTNVSNVSLIEFDELMSRFFKYEFWGFYGKLYQRRVFENIKFPIETLSEDYFVMSQIFINERKMVYTDYPLYNYEYHADSLSHTKISNRAFEEFENVKAVYELINEESPQYADMALSNTVETSIKLLSMSKKSNKDLYNKNIKELHDFISRHLVKIIYSKSIYWKLKILALKSTILHK